MQRATNRGRAVHGAVRIKQAYGEPERSDGYRVLVDRLWPRGIRKEALSPNEWIREIAPSDQLRRWFGHETERWPEFQQRYRRELSTGAALESLEHLVELARRGKLTLLYSAHDEEHNNAVVLQSVIEKRLRRGRSKPRAPRVAASRSRTAARAKRKRPL